MPFVRQQPGQKPGDQQREQVEQTSGLQRESGLIGSTGGSLHEGMQRPSAPTPTQEAPQQRSRALNLSDYAAANVDKTRALAQQTAARVTGGARRSQERLGQAQQEFTTLASQGPTVQEGLQETRDIQQKQHLTEADRSRYTQLTGGYKGPEALGDVDTGLASQLGATSQQGQLAQTAEGQRGLLQQRLGTQGGQAAAGVGQRGFEAATQASQVAQTRAADLQQLSQQAAQNLQQEVAGVGQEVTQQTEQAQAQAAADQARIESMALRNPNVKKFKDAADKAGEVINTINVENATKGVSPEYQQQVLTGQLDPASTSWQTLKSHYDANGWNDAQGEEMASNMMKLINATWSLRKANEKLTNLTSTFTQDLSEGDRQALQQYGIDPANLMQQMNLRTGKTATDQYRAGGWDWRSGDYYGSGSDANIQGLTSTAQYTGAQGGKSLQDVINEYGIEQPTITKESTMTSEQQNRLRALQQLASRSGQ